MPISCSSPRYIAPQNGNFHLQASSPCIDAGDPATPHDPDSTLADMGAFYYAQSVETVIPTPKSLPNDFLQVQTYPNPFNPTTAISFELASCEPG